MATTIPIIEIRHDTDPPRIGRPDGKAHTIHRMASLTDGQGMRAEHLKWPKMTALAEKIQILIAQLRTKAECISVNAAFAGRPLHLQAIIEALAAPRDYPFEQAIGMAQANRRNAPSGGCILNRDGCGTWQKRANP